MSERSKFWLSHLSAIAAEGITTKAHAEREGLSLLETRHIEVNPVRRLVCGVQEMLEPEAVMTVVRLGHSGCGRLQSLPIVCAR